ncbi:ADP-ribose glycohydrolase MACROD2-like isoform X2 [Moschus berezovskii]|nr:ADP-ribose glycohydrolase MACROD2-like isoform X2 [Moschus berezovskii]
MGEFFPTDDNNEEEDADMKEDSEGLEPKDHSPPHKKSKAKKPEGSKDSSEEDESGPEEKPSAEETEEQSHEADGTSMASAPSPSSEGALEGWKDEDSAEDDNIRKGNEATDHSVCDQEHPSGQENDSTKKEVKLEAESQSSHMETEELSSSQDDAMIVEQPEVTPLTDDQEGNGGDKAQGGNTPRVPVKSEGSGDRESSTSPDVDMNCQVDSVNDPTESQQED